MAVLAAVLALTAGTGFAGTWLGALSMAGVLLGFLSFVGLGLWWGPGINSCACPSCARRLRRPSGTTEFVCEDCRQTWWTRGTGEYWWD
jgi:hypothetical protein